MAESTPQREPLPSRLMALVFTDIMGSVDLKARLGLTLPTEAQWEYGARGVVGRRWAERARAGRS